MRTLIAAYKTLDGSSTGNLAVGPTHLRDFVPAKRIVASSTSTHGLAQIAGSCGSDVESMQPHSTRGGRMKKIAMSFGLLAGLACVAVAGTARAADDAAARAQVGQLVERFQAAIIAHDKTALESMFVAEGGSWFEVLGEDAYREMKVKRPGLSRVHADNYRHFAAFIGDSKQSIQEQFSNVRIQTDGAVASVYFDFVFLVDGKRNNVGSETWQLVHTGDGWKISAMAYSSYPDRTR